MNYLWWGERGGQDRFPHSKHTNKKRDGCNKTLWKASFALLPKWVLNYLRGDAPLFFIFAPEEQRDALAAESSRVKRAI